MTAVLAQPTTRRQIPERQIPERQIPVRQVRVRRAAVRLAATAAPDVRREHPVAPARRPAGPPAPSLRRGALPDRLRVEAIPVGPATLSAPSPACSTSPAAAGGWRLTDRAIRLILAVLVIVMLASLAVVVGKLIQVTSPATESAGTGPAVVALTG